MKKIDILSYTNTANYGGLLQLYSLSKVLSTEYQVEVIRYKNGNSLQRSKLRNFLSFLYNKVFRFLSVDKRRQKNENVFRQFIPFSTEEYNPSNPINTISCDYFITGSDQVWNPYLNGFDNSYLLSFDTKAKKISYAASFGIEKLPPKWADEVKKALCGFKHISLREKTGENILDSMPELNGLEKTVDLDPTLLISRKEWIDSFCVKRLFDKKYVLIYLMPGDKNLEKKIIKLGKRVAKSKGCKLAIIGRKNIDKINPFKRGYYHAGPSEFVNLIYYSEFVLTNSFHGTAFSVNLNKDFVSFINSNQNSASSLKSRIVDFLNSVSLTDAIFDINCSQEIKTESLNFELSNTILLKMREDSLMHLFNGLKNEK